MTRASIGFAGFVDEAGAVPFPGAEPVPFSEASGAGLAVADLAAEAKGSVRSGCFFWDDGGSVKLARGPRVGALSGKPDPQPTSPARSNRLKGSIRRGQTGSKDGLDRRMPSGLSGGVVNENVTGENTR